MFIGFVDEGVEDVGRGDVAGRRGGEEGGECFGEFYEAGGGGRGC